VPLLTATTGSAATAPTVVVVVAAGGAIWPERLYLVQIALVNAIGVGPLGPVLAVTTPPSVPILSALSPPDGPTSGATVVTVSGDQFGHTASELLAVELSRAASASAGGAELVVARAAAQTWVSATQIVITTAAAWPPGSWVMNVTTTLGSSTVYAAVDSAAPERPVNDLAFVYNPRPNVTAVVPRAVPRATAALFEITMFGSDFGASSSELLTVGLGDVSHPCAAAPSRASMWVSATQIVCAVAAPPAAASRGPVTVGTARGGLGAGADFWFTVPTVLRVTPRSGIYAGGTPVLLEGLWLLGATPTPAPSDATAAAADTGAAAETSTSSPSTSTTGGTVRAGLEDVAAIEFAECRSSLSRRRRRRRRIRRLSVQRPGRSGV
jgi:hypothetical protein